MIRALKARRADLAVVPVLEDVKFVTEWQIEAFERELVFGCFSIHETYPCARVLRLNS